MFLRLELIFNAVENAFKRGSSEDGGLRIFFKREDDDIDVFF